MIIEIDVTDEITPATQRALEHSEGFLRSVTKSVGWWFRKEAKAGAASGAPNGEAYEERIPYKVRKALNPKAPRGWYGKLKNAIAYDYIAKGTVGIGWTSSTAAAYGRIQEYGATRQVTYATRRFWAHAGHPLRPNINTLNVPARPIFEPMVRALQPQIAPYVEEKVSSYIKENVSYGKANRRKYKVHK